jgi:hypothetical protein
MTSAKKLSSVPRHHHFFRSCPNNRFKIVKFHIYQQRRGNGVLALTAYPFTIFPNELIILTFATTVTTMFH